MDFSKRIDNLALAYLHQSLDLPPTDDEFVGWVNGVRSEKGLIGLEFARYPFQNLRVRRFALFV